MIQRLKALLSGQNSVTGAAAILVATTLVSNILGLLRDRFFAQKVPIDLLDAYFASFRLPDFIFNLLILGTVSAAFIPVFLAEQQKGQERAWEMAHRAITLALVALIGLSVVLFAAMPVLVPLMVPEFSLEKQELTTQLTRILLIQPIFFGLSYLFSGILNAMKRFFVYALAPLIYTACIIASTLLFADTYGVYALVWGVVIGSFFHMFIQFLTAQSVGFRFTVDFHFRDPAVLKLLRLMVPRGIALGSMQLMLLVFTGIASALGSGSVASYNFADNIQTMPTAVFGLSFITALYPTLSEAAAKRELSRYADLLWRGIRYLLVILVPAGLGLLLLRSEIVRLILGTGHFGWEATVVTAQTLGFFAVSLFAQAIGALLARSFYALHDTTTPTIHQLVGYGVSVALAFVLAPATGLGMGVPGLALAFSIGSALTMGLLYWSLRRRVPSVQEDESALWPLLQKLALGSIALVVGVQLAKLLTAQLVDLDHFWEVFLRAGSAMLVGASAYWLVMAALRVEELSLIIDVVRSRLWPSAGRPRPSLIDADVRPK